MIDTDEARRWWLIDVPYSAPAPASLRDRVAVYLDEIDRLRAQVTVANDCVWKNVEEIECLQVELSEGRRLGRAVVAESDEFLARAERAEAALARVEALCDEEAAEDELHAVVPVKDVRAALRGDTQ